MFSYDDVRGVCADEELVDAGAAAAYCQSYDSMDPRMDILADPEAAADGRWIYWYQVNGQRMPVDCGSEAVYRVLVRSDWRERKQLSRRSRCLVPGEQGLRRCTGRCSECGFFRSGKFLSLEELSEVQGFQVASPVDGVSDVLVRVMLEDLVEKLTRIRPEYGRIFMMLYEGVSVAEMARRMGRPRKTMEYWMKKVREEAKKWVKRRDVGG